MKKVPFCNLSVPVGLVGLTILAGAFLTLPNTNADDVVDQINITVPESCTVEGVIATGGEHTKTVQNNQYYSEIGTTTFKTYCNDNNGYAIYAVGYSNDEIGNTLMKHNVSSAYDFNTGVADSGNTSNWAMKLAPISGTYAPTIHSDTNGAFSSYHVVPSTYTKVVSFASNTDLPATGVNAVGSGFTSTYASWISATQVAGTYTGKVRYTLVHPMTEVPLQPQTTEAGCIRYYPNGSNVEGTMGCRSISASATSATLLASNFSRAGYGFAGWSTTYDYSDNTGFLGPQEDITFTAGQYTGSNNGLSLYARWIKSAGNLQDWTGCSSLASGTVTALTDQRDNETYAIAKLADGKCWMIENLRLDNTATLTLANTNSPLNDGTNVTLKHNYSDTETHNTLAASQDPTATAWCSSNAASCDDQSMLFTGNTTNRKTDSVNNDGNIYSYGNYYNWYSATAGRGTYSFSTNNSSVVGDLCPSGWHLPKGGSSANATNSDFWQLGLSIMGAAPSNNSKYTSSETNTAGKTATAAIRSYPNNFVYSGRVNNSFVNDRGSYGYYWSSTANSSSYTYDLLLNLSNVNPGSDVYLKYYGRAVRCVVSGV